MSDFIRPELRAALWRLRDAIAAAVVVALGLWWAVFSFGVVRWLGYALIIVGAGLMLAGLQRARFRRGSDGPGIVQITERRVAYFGPLTGGVIDVADLTELALEPAAYPAPHWVLSGAQGQDIAIPVTAAGAEALFDVFASLPGMRTQTLLDVLERTPPSRIVIWQQRRPLLQS